jgi:4-hydroxy-3-methylbut-2-enyl diphosphate reductase
MRVKRATKYGFCAGVRVAGSKVRDFAAQGGRGSILGPLVHNERVVEELEGLGLTTVDGLERANGPTVIFSAHGVPPSFFERARALGLEVLDTTCTFVRDIHEEVARASGDGSHMVIFGDPSHREVVGYTHDLEPDRFHVISSADDVRSVDWSSYRKIAVIYQTTLNADDFEESVRFIEERNPNTVRTETVCYATRENQDAVRELAADPEVALVLVIGGRDSANTRHLWEIAARSKTAHLIEGIEAIDPHWLEGVACVGLTAGASTPDVVIDEVQQYLEGFGGQRRAGHE